MSNPFLTNFLKMRKEITMKNEVVVTKAKASVKSELHSLKEPSPELTYKTIIAEQPPAKEVCEYFRSMITDLGKED